MDFKVDKNTEDKFAGDSTFERGTMLKEQEFPKRSSHADDQKKQIEDKLAKLEEEKRHLPSRRNQV